MYSCGPTVYDYFHIGNARTFLISDIVRRYLEYKGYTVTMAQNLTDIDDKIINRANEQGIDTSELAQKYVDAYFEDSSKLGIRAADVHPRATEHISEIITLIQALIDKQAAYEIDGDVYYRVNHFAEYGKLSHRKPEDLLAGARVEVDERKEDPRDFDLWKKSKAEEPWWDSPWGKGRPGWHIECSAMAMKHLGETIDIHTGGHDLIFPHHENEIAQSEVVTGKTFARYWMHVAFLQIDGRRMGKSESNFIFVHDAVQQYAAEAIRHFLISAQYRHPLDYNPTSLTESSSAVRRLNNCFDALRPYRDADGDVSEALNDAEAMRTLESINTMHRNFESAMDEDFNTAGALGAIFKCVGEVNQFLTATEGISSDERGSVLSRAYKGLVEVCSVLGIYAEEEVASDAHAALTEQLMSLILEVREDARQRKDWETADKIRGQLEQLNVELQDSRGGTTWKIIKGVR
ncbi:Cysteine--tRNA ligase [Geodia barretti]|uniref:Cysteine--tRNA ligase n=1 Tax=Geodia barretti TaxID=519541 RepID=A0AA35ST88_GEOBA|nr:Cysteine--tRNA ligase [Geodia barretti]